MIASMSPYLLLQSRDPGDPMREHEVECFRSTLAMGPDELVVVDALERVPSKEELAGARAVLMGGSGDYSSLDEEPWIERMTRWTREVLLASDVPTFASCFGFQVMVRALGGEMVRDPENREVGSLDLCREKAAAADPIFGDLPSKFVAQVGHTDRAAEAPPGTDVLASSERCPVHAYRVRGKSIWATQFHPELDVAAVRVRYLRYAEKYPPPDLPEGTKPEDAPFLSTLRPSPEASRLLERFAGWCLRQELDREAARGVR
jgi:GMP synthase (glutamine-hydrolysing)